MAIQFGHNDQKQSDPARYADPENVSAYLNQFVQDVEAKGASVIIIVFAGVISLRKVLKRTLLEYADAAKKVAAQNNVPFPMNRHSAPN